MQLGCGKLLFEQLSNAVQFRAALFCDGFTLPEHCQHFFDLVVCGGHEWLIILFCA
jgi:hypothetical protein